jgi:dipeptidyl aminopeptidase/acylaminoacyl peptidase
MHNVITLNAFRYVYLFVVCFPILFTLSFCTSIIEHDETFETPDNTISYPYPDNLRILDFAASPVEDILSFIVTKDTLPTREIRVYRIGGIPGGEVLYHSRSELSNLKWSPDGIHLLFLENDSLRILTPDSGNAFPDGIPFKTARLVRWISSNSLLLVRIHTATEHLFYRLDVQNQQCRLVSTSSPILVTDIAWLPGSNNIMATVPDNNRLITFQVRNTQLELSKSIALDAHTIKSAPEQSNLYQGIGPYLLVRGQENLGIFFPEKQIISWLTHLQSDQILHADWRFDGEYIFYIPEHENSIYQELILFPQNSETNY